MGNVERGSGGNVDPSGKQRREALKPRRSVSARGEWNVARDGGDRVWSAVVVHIVNLDLITVSMCCVTQADKALGGVFTALTDSTHWPG